MNNKIELVLSLFIGVVMVFYFKDEAQKGYTFSENAEYLYVSIVIIQSILISTCIHKIYGVLFYKIKESSYSLLTFHFGFTLSLLWFFLILFNLSLTKNYSEKIKLIYYDEHFCQQEICNKKNKEIEGLLSSKTLTDNPSDLELFKERTGLQQN